MEHKIILTRNIIIFYILIGLPLSYLSLDNLINGIILQKNDIIGIGAFSLGGFILFPLLILGSYRNNKCILTTQSIKIGKKDYPYQEYYAELVYIEKPLKDRPLFTPFKKHYPKLIITKRETNEIFFEEDLSCSKKEIELLKQNLPNK